MVYLNRFKKDIIPGYIPPMEDELYSSWLCRLANNLLVSTLDLVNSHMGDYLLYWDRDVDMYAKKEYVDFITTHTPLEASNAMDLFLDSYDGIYFLNERGTGISRHFLSLGLNQ